MAIRNRVGTVVQRSTFRRHRLPMVVALKTYYTILAKLGNEVNRARSTSNLVPRIRGPASRRREPPAPSRRHLHRHLVIKIEAYALCRNGVGCAWGGVKGLPPLVTRPRPPAEVASEQGRTHRKKRFRSSPCCLPQSPNSAPCKPPCSMRREFSQQT